MPDPESPLPVVVRLAYLFDATEPPTLPKHLERWFPHESIKPEEELQGCADNTFFFSRPAREFLFPEIVEMERDIMSTRPGVFDEVELMKLSDSAALSSEIAKRWKSAKHVAPGRRSGLRRYVATHLDGVSRSANGWKVEATLSGKGWERTVESGIFWISTLEIHVYAPNLGCVVIDVAADPDKDEEREEREELTKDLAALTKDVISPNSLLDDEREPLLPIAKLKLDGSDCELTWYEVLDTVTRPFRSHDRLPRTSLLNENNQEFGQYFRRLWFLPDSTMADALNCVRVNYLRPFDKGRPPKVIDVPKSSVDLDEGWCGLVHHHEFIVSGPDDPDESHGWWYRAVLSGVVWQDYAWLWLLAATKKVQLARLLGDLDLSSPRNAEVELKRFYEFMQKENFVAPSTQPMGNRLMEYLDEQTGAKRLIDEIKQEAEAIRESVIEGSVRRQGSALALIAVLGTWLALGELSNANGKLGFSELWNWVKQGAVFSSGAAIFGLYLLLTKRRGRHRLR
jgi:hypothetical protein